MTKKIPHEIARRDKSANEWSSIAGSPLGLELFNYLNARGKLPPIRRSFLGEGINGTFTYGWGVPEPYITLAPYAELSTGVHEAAHAADNRLERQYYDRNMSWNMPESPADNTQFTRGYEKLKGNVKLARSEKHPLGYVDRRYELASLLDPDWSNKKARYRSTHNELGGFAAGSTVPGGFDQEDNKPPPHLNSTLATELAILLDLAMRERQYKKK